ncbi:MAG: winged helix-turn-helix domain-containing protein [Geminicoccaceae bacterium]|jgi:TolB-like protein/Tfp pilus assembly protein PilF|nr:winged helix-turn-helix domain-containing protein [Geminicoccaceae bacterium]HRY25087.1 winged helix-turn-helix domain-containing protein [Geminicoccaceae bacterium]
MALRFDRCTIDPDAFELRRDGEVVPVEPQVLELLLFLATNPGRLVTRDELVEAVWRGRIVSEATIASRIKAARRAIGDDGTAQRLIATVHGRGFRFLAGVRDDADGTPASPAAPPIAIEVPTDRPSLAVLPFRYLADDPAYRFLLAGLQDEVTAGLGRVRSYLVVNSGSAASAAAVSDDLRAIGAGLGVRYLVTGSLRAGAGRLRVTAHLVEAASGIEVWSGRFESEAGDTFELQDAITEALIGALSPALYAAEADRLKRQRPAVLAAYDRVLKAIPDCWAVERAASRRAMAELEAAIAADPDYGLAHALLSWCHGQQVVYNWTSRPADHRATALTLARRGYALDPTDSMVLTLLATAESAAGEVLAARRHLDRGLEIDSNCCWAWNRSGYLHCYTGDPDAGIADFERSLRLSPLDPLRHLSFVGMGLAGFVAADYPSALGWIDRALADRPGILWVNRLVAACAALAGDMERAARAVAIVQGYAPGIRADDIVRAIPHQVEATRERYRRALVLAGFRP